MCPVHQVKAADCVQLHWWVCCLCLIWTCQHTWFLLLSKSWLQFFHVSVPSVDLWRGQCPGQSWWLISGFSFWTHHTWNNQPCKLRQLGLIVTFTAQTHLSVWRQHLPANSFKAWRASHNICLMYGTEIKHMLHQKSWTIFTLLFQYPLRFFYSASVIVSLVIYARLLESRNDCSRLTSSQAAIWSRESGFIGI